MALPRKLSTERSRRTPLGKQATRSVPQGSLTRPEIQGTGKDCPSHKYQQNHPANMQRHFWFSFLNTRVRGLILR
ncbi:hypothetical protein IQ243_11630 [Nostocales cyanobacterium LEGE 11386]|nr:hypothetical protein [Nostocales cyanobacterium LEGE 11386]